MGSQRNREDLAHLDRVIERLIHELDDILEPLSHRETKDKRKADLIRICKRAEQLGMLLLSQPAEWMFDWTYYSTKQTEREPRDQPRRPGRNLVVYPALFRLTNNVAGKLTRTRPLLEARVLR